MALQVIILAAGQSKRMKSKTSKVLHPLGGQRVIDYVFSLAHQIQASQTIVVTSPHTTQDPWPEHVEVVIQDPPRGTGDAVKKAFPLLKGQGDVLVLFGDTPLITQHTLSEMIDVQNQDVALTVLGMRPPNPSGYGRLIENENGDLLGIIEHKDLPADKKCEEYCNSGVMLIKRGLLADFLDQISSDNAQGEYYLTDLVSLATQAGLKCRAVEGDFEELLGIDDRQNLAQAEQILQNRWRIQAMEQGTTLIDPETIRFSYDTLIASDVTLHPHVILGPGVHIEEGSEILPFSYIVNSRIGSDCVVGPFARLRGQTVLDDKAEVGNFVELKKTRMKKGAKAKHLSYLGDADIGAEANIGAGTITCNYDGFNKFKTDVGPGAFIGTNCSLVAPLSIGEGAIVGAGSVITQDVQDNQLAITRAEQKNIPAGAQKFRSKRSV